MRTGVLFDAPVLSYSYAEGEALEQGKARQADLGWWEYVPKVDGTIEATVWDLAGNQAKSIL